MLDVKRGFPPLKLKNLMGDVHVHNVKTTNDWYTSKTVSQTSYELFHQSFCVKTVGTKAKLLYIRACFIM